MTSKKGFELSTNLLVLTIFSIVTFILGLALVGTLFSQGSKTIDSLEPDAQQRIAAELGQGRPTVVYPAAIKVARGKNGVIGIGMQNLQASDQSITITAAPGPAEDISGAALSPLDAAGITVPNPIHRLGPRDSAQTFILVKVPPAAPPGTYEIDIGIGSQSHRAYVTVP